MTKNFLRDSLSWVLLIFIIWLDNSTNLHAFVGYNICLLLYLVEMQWFFVDDDAIILWSIILVYEKKFPRDSLSFAISIVIILHDKDTDGNAFVGYNIYLLLYSVEMQ